jgi:spore maturation protein A
MLNYVWMGLVAAGILVAAGHDIRNEVVNPFRNGLPLEATITAQGEAGGAGMKSWEGLLVIPGEQFSRFYGLEEAPGVRQLVRVIPGEGTDAVMHVMINESSPEMWRTMARYGLNKDRLSARIRSLAETAEGEKKVMFVTDPVRFVKLRAVTQAAFDYAATAVTLALGLIGIMTMWLGVMRVADESGAVKILTRLLTPITRRLFPEVPPEHPAVGAMIMNISANMLGLSNAATPFGLKAMEELNKLNPRVGTATNAMCTFLAINTAGLVILPATAMAVRAAAGSANPGLIIGTSIFGAGCATVAGLVAVKLLQRMPRFRNDDPEREGQVVSHG